MLLDLTTAYQKTKRALRNNSYKMSKLTVKRKPKTSIMNKLIAVADMVSPRRLINFWRSEPDPILPKSSVVSSTTGISSPVILADVRSTVSSSTPPMTATTTTLNLKETGRNDLMSGRITDSYLNYRYVPSSYMLITSNMKCVGHKMLFEYIPYQGDQADLGLGQSGKPPKDKSHEMMLQTIITLLGLAVMGHFYILGSGSRKLNYELDVIFVVADVTALGTILYGLNCSGKSPVMGHGCRAVGIYLGSITLISAVVFHLVNLHISVTASSSPPPPMA